MTKTYLKLNVYEAAKARIRTAIETYDDFSVSFSGGKDSGALVNLVLEVARKLNRLPVKVVFSDLEAIFQETERYARSIMDSPEVEPYWLCLEEIDDNATSVYQRYFRMWGEGDDWCRDMPDMPYVIHKHNIPGWLQPYYQPDVINEWTIEKMGEALCDKTGATSMVNFVGLRTDESYGRLMNIRAAKNRDKANNHTYRYKHRLPRTWMCLPIYDWSVSDVWHYHAIKQLDYNRVYDAMQWMGIPLHEQRTCCAFGEEQKKTLWQWCIIEPETWERMVTRVAGANFGKLYNHTNLNRMKVKKPDGISWQEYTTQLLHSLPDPARELFEDKFKTVFRYHRTMYEEKEGIPPEVYIQDNRKAARDVAEKTGLGIKHFISWETLAGAIIKRDFVFKKYGFGYSKKMQDRVLRMEQQVKDL